jgi:Domain of unknown function (DUF1990)
VGHPVLGEETFSVEKDLATGQIRVALRSWSRPGILLARMLAPAMRLVQGHAVRAALDHLAGLVRLTSTGPGADAVPRATAKRRGHSTFWLVRHV